ncbi:carotenoid oxygenase family protein [Alteraurantiacibacter palmitatis]|uniref:Dioxygenase n=1 Tax=Alteraurantiacibacter palmitatis TaxID=2054628 RepID=A0ABV7EBP8_9SPHN
MALTYANHPALQGPMEPARFASQVHDCEVVGEIPAGLKGTFFRVGAEWLYPPKFPDDSPFAADGIASAFRIADGSCDFAARFVETPRYLANKAARRQLFGYYRNPFTDEPEATGISGTVSNTNIIVFAGRLLALKEDALPYEVDPATLATIGPHDFGGGYSAPTFTAHPKVDGQTGEMITYGYEAEGLASNAIWVYTIAPDGRVTSERRIAAPYLSMVHDIAISQNFILIPVYGMVSGMERLRAGKVHWGWDGTVPSYIGVMPRRGNGDVVWVAGPEMAMVHTFSASDDGGVIALIAAVSDSNPFPFFPDVHGKPFDPAKARTTIRKYVIDLARPADGWREEVLFPEWAGALSRIDERYCGHPFRYGFLSAAHPAMPYDAAVMGPRPPSNALARFDFATGTVEAMHCGETLAVSEIAFAPRSPDAPEGDGWVMAFATDYTDMKSQLVIGDTANLAAGPLARVKLPFRAPGQIHGNWVPDWVLPV